MYPSQRHPVSRISSTKVSKSMKFSYQCSATVTPFLNDTQISTIVSINCVPFRQSVCAFRCTISATKSSVFPGQWKPSCSSYSPSQTPTSKSAFFAFHKGGSNSFLGSKPIKHSLEGICAGFEGFGWQNCLAHTACGTRKPDKAPHDTPRQTSRRHEVSCYQTVKYCTDLTASVAAIPLQKPRHQRTW